MKLANIVVLIMNLLTLVTLVLAIFTDWNEGGYLTLALRFWLVATVVNLFFCKIKRENTKDDK